MLQIKNFNLKKHVLKICLFVQINKKMKFYFQILWFFLLFDRNFCDDEFIYLLKRSLA